MGQEINIGETFEWDGKALKAVADTNECSGCDYCYFKDNPSCLWMNCGAIERVDDTNVHFEAVNEK